MPHSQPPSPDTHSSPHPALRPALIGKAHDPFLARLKAGAHLLEAGCGAGEDLQYFRELGFVVTAFDASLSQARTASRLCGQPVRVCRFDQMHNVVPFDGIWASGSLPCLPETELAPALAHLAGLLKPQAPLYCSFPYDEGEPGSDLPPSQDEYPLQTRLDEARLQQLIAPLSLGLHQTWCSEDAVNGRWLHALLLRLPDLSPTIHQYRRRRFQPDIARNSSST